MNGLLGYLSDMVSKFSDVHDYNSGDNLNDLPLAEFFKTLSSIPKQKFDAWLCVVKHL